MTTKPNRTTLQVASAAWGRIRRVAAPEGKRAHGGTGRPVASYEAASSHPLIPRVNDPAPNMTARQQRFMQILARHLFRNDPWIRNLVRVMGDIHIGTGPVPVSRFPERDALFARASKLFDHSGVRGFGGWLREDVYRNKVVDGEVWPLRRNHIDKPLASSLLVPITYQTLTSEFVPHDFTQRLDGVPYVNGVALDDGRVRSYAVYPQHPSEPGMHIGRLQAVDVSELYHVFDPSTGAVRGEVVLASALLRAIKASTLEDAELRRKHIASLMSVAIHRPADDYDNFELPSEDEVSAMIDAISLSPGGVFELPYGYDAKLIAPPDEGQNFEKALRWQLMAVCAAAGIPPHEVLGDWNALPERMARYVGQSMERRATIVQQDLEHQLLNGIYRDFVDTAMATGLWIPPAGIDPLELYDVTWEWPMLPMASFKQELIVMMAAEAAGHIDSETISKSMFGMRRKDVARRRASAAATDAALGLVYKDPRWAAGGSDIASQLLQLALEEEQRELDLQAEAALDTGILQDA